MKKLVLAIVSLVLCTLAFGQNPGIANIQQQLNSQQPAPAHQKKYSIAKAVSSPDSSTSCSFNFSSGTSNTFLSYCVSGNGNVLQIETPQGQTQLPLGNGEGYGVCDFASGIAYSDFGPGGITNNWGAATVVSHSATSVKIARTTTDGIWTLTQTIAQVSGNTANVKITMALKNNSAVERRAFLVRYGDADASHVTSNELDATFNMAFAYNSIFVGDGTPSGLVLQNQGNSPFFFGAATRNTFDPPDPCDPLLFAAGELISTDGSLSQIYLMDLAKAKTGTVTTVYRGL